MAGAATASPFISLTCTNSLSPLTPSRIHSFRPQLQSVPLRSTSHNGHSRLITSRQAKLNDSTVEEELEDIDEAFAYNGDVIGEEDDSDEDDGDTESSVDLLLRFLQSMFKKVSKRVRKASRSVLPAVIPPELVSFAVDGVLILASLSILKALLEVACNIGGSVFVVILLLRVIWAATSYYQSNGNNFNQSGSSYGRTQPVT
ncbi:protein SHORT HYPOCOTYL IN WHITE LIGHT 1 [Actinidia eriantha]|uniref:protein SHORT HYPOCOTYL IN WHITE LIGHT 1 n=1 Tax=Actinidia eriantha TaxID=165200 RepID=UPI002590FDC6|nr:protein SHORT HYPOCOTYL IN WHITE LIGHT 1 [Actinidia eriantha]